MSDVTFTSEEQKQLKALSQTENLYKTAVALIQRSHVRGEDIFAAAEVISVFNQILQNTSRDAESINKSAQLRSKQESEAPKAEEKKESAAK